MTGQSLDQQRAKHALDRVVRLQSEPGRYVSYVNALPATILMNGLGQALATERAAEDNRHHVLANDVASWLLDPPSNCRYGQPSPAEAPENDQVQRLLHRIVAGDQDAYLRAQIEAIAYLGWLKRFANAFLKKES